MKSLKSLTTTVLLICSAQLAFADANPFEKFLGVYHVDSCKCLVSGKPAISPENDMIQVEVNAYVDFAGKPQLQLVRVWDTDYRITTLSDFNNTLATGQEEQSLTGDTASATRSFERVKNAGRTSRAAKDIFSKDGAGFRLIEIDNAVENAVMVLDRNCDLKLTKK